MELQPSAAYLVQRPNGPRGVKVLPGALTCIVWARRDLSQASSKGFAVRVALFFIVPGTFDRMEQAPAMGHDQHPGHD